MAITILIIQATCLAIIEPSTGSDQTSLKFYAFSNSKCPPCVEKMNLLSTTFPNSSTVVNEMEDSAEYFQEILRTFNESLSREIVPPLPLVGVFEDNGLKAISGGAISKQRWIQVTGSQHEGVLLYLEDSSGGPYINITIKETDRIRRLEGLFKKEAPILGMGTGFLSLIVPVTAAALVDAVNPCAFNTFVVLLTFTLFSAGKKGVLKVGLAFSAAVFVVYYVLGLGIIRFIGFIPQLRYLIALGAGALGILKLIEASGKKIKYVPSALAERLSSRLESSMNPKSGFIAGALTAAFLLPCSSAPYFVALDLLQKQATLFEGLALLGVYNLIMVGPFIALTLGVHAVAISTMDVKLWAQEKQKWINLFMGAVLIALSIFVLLT